MQEDAGDGRSYSDAEAAADLAAYRGLKWWASLWSLLLVGVPAVVLVWWFPRPAVALAAGGICGVLNTLLTMRSGERLVKTRSVGLFVFSSFLRIGVFGIVPVAFVAKGPWWSMVVYFAGFFLPFTLSAFKVSRRFDSNQRCKNPSEST